MAILFNCPYCTSQIKVPDHAAGKKGTCPRCGTAVLVPRVEIPPQPAATSSAPQASTPANAGVSAGLDADAPFLPPDLPVDDGGEPVFPSAPQFPAPEAGDGSVPVFAPAAPAAGPSIAKALKKRQRSRSSSLAMPIMGVTILFSILFYFFWQQRPVLHGELQGTKLPGYLPPPGMITRAELRNLPKENVDYVLDALENEPERLLSSLMTTQLTGTRQGLRVTLQEGKDAHFFRVNPSANEHFRNWCDEHIEELSEARSTDYDAAVKRFFEEYVQSEGRMADIGSYRDPLAVNAMVGAVGYNMVAIVGRTAYLCVYEDPATRDLYFLLPKDVQKFELQGRTLADGTSLFPGHYDVPVTRTIAPKDNSPM